MLLLRIPICVGGGESNCFFAVPHAPLSILGPAGDCGIGDGTGGLAGGGVGAVGLVGDGAAGATEGGAAGPVGG